MSAETTRLLLVAGLAVLAGGAAGAYATRLVYGDGPAPVHPITAREKVCPPCDCPACPPPPECPGVEPSHTATTPRVVLPPDEEEQPRRPGLPASAMRRARDLTLEELSACVELAKQTRSSGTVLLELTVTATGGEGFISEVRVGDTDSEGEIEASVLDCLRSSPRRVRFDWDAEDGESHLQLPVRLAH